MEYDVRNIFLKNAENEEGRIAPDLVLFFIKALYEVKEIYSLWIGHTIKTNCIKPLVCWPRDMLNINFSEKGLGLDSPPHFRNGFSRKMLIHILFTDEIS